MKKLPLAAILAFSAVALLGIGSIFAISTGALGGARATATPDPCAPANIDASVEQVHDLMREFYDASALASQAPASELPQIIPSLQSIRRRAEDQTVPACLAKLKGLQLSHMNTVINTMMAFMAQADPNVLVQGIAQARTLNEQYKQEMARLTGTTYVPPPAATAAPTSATPEDTQTPAK